MPISSRPAVFTGVPSVVIFNPTWIKVDTVEQVAMDTDSFFLLIYRLSLLGLRVLQIIPILLLYRLEINAACTLPVPNQ